jgi:hypothetical protein
LHHAMYNDARASSAVIAAAARELDKRRRERRRGVPDCLSGERECSGAPAGLCRQLRERCCTERSAVNRLQQVARFSRWLQAGCLMPG